MIDALRRLLLRVLAIFTARALDRDLQAEFDMHLALAAEEHIRHGLSTDEARRRARLEFGGVAAAKERHGEARGLPIAQNARQDVAFALRGFRRHRGFTVLAVLILALGIGVNTAVFSIVSPLLLRTLPFRDASQLVWISPAFTDGRSAGTYSTGVFDALKRRSASFSDLSAYFASFGVIGYTLTGSGPAEGVVGTMVAPRFFEMLGIQPAAGRFFSTEEAKPASVVAAVAPTSAVISHSLWQRRFAGNTALVGQTIAVNNRAVTVVGILPADFDFGSVFAPATRVDLFIPAPLDAMQQWGNALAVVGRLKPGTSLASARTEIAALLPTIRRDHSEWGPVTAVATDLRTAVNGRFRRSLILLCGAVGFVLLIACANLSNLLMARTAARRREFGIRMTLGAGQARVARQLLTEGLLLALLGAAAGLPLAYGVTQYAKASTMLAVPLMDRIQIDRVALLFTAAAAVVTGLACMTMPVLGVFRRHPHDVLSEHTRTATDGRAQRSVRSALVVSEMALACVMLVGAGLLTRSLLRVLNHELGFQPSHAVAVRLNMSPDWSPEGRAHRDALLEELTERIRHLPGVEAASVTDALPLERSRGWRVRVPGRIDPPNQTPSAFVYVTGPEYLSTMRIPLTAGSDFSRQDIARDRGSVIVNGPLARRLWPDEDPLGRTLLTDVPGTYTVVGVAVDVRQAGLEERPAFQMYLPYTQVPPGSMDLIIRSSLPAASLAASVRAALSLSDPNLMSSELRSIEDLVDRSVSPRRFLAGLIGAFSLVALVLACLGVYGVVSCTVSQRVHEIGVRMALGATARDVRRQVLRGTVRLAVAGVAVGCFVSIGVARVITGLLYDTSPLDPMTFAGTTIVLIVVALAAGYVPAARAAAIDPMSALRAD